MSLQRSDSDVGTGLKVFDRHNANALQHNLDVWHSRASALTNTQRTRAPGHRNMTRKMVRDALTMPASRDYPVPITPFFFYSCSSSVQNTFAVQLSKTCMRSGPSAGEGNGPGNSLAPTCTKSLKTACSTHNYTLLPRRDPDRR